MLFAVRFFDMPDTLHIRTQYFPAHLAWIDEHQSSVLVAGGLRHEPDGNPAGALWIVEAHSKEEVEALFQTDPFWVNGLRKSVEIMHWSKAFPDRKTLV